MNYTRALYNSDNGAKKFKMYQNYAIDRIRSYHVKGHEKNVLIQRMASYIEKIVKLSFRIEGCFTIRSKGFKRYVTCYRIC